MNFLHWELQKSKPWNSIFSNLHVPSSNSNQCPSLDIFIANICKHRMHSDLTSIAGPLPPTNISLLQRVSTPVQGLHKHAPCSCMFLHESAQKAPIPLRKQPSHNEEVVMKSKRTYPNYQRVSWHHGNEKSRFTSMCMILHVHVPYSCMECCVPIAQSMILSWQNILCLGWIRSIHGAIRPQPPRDYIQKQLRMKHVEALARACQYLDKFDNLSWTQIHKNLHNRHCT